MIVSACRVRVSPGDSDRESTCLRIRRTAPTPGPSTSFIARVSSSRVVSFRCSAASAATRPAIAPFTTPVCTIATAVSMAPPSQLAPTTCSCTVSRSRFRESSSPVRVTWTRRRSALKIGSEARTRALWWLATARPAKPRTVARVTSPCRRRRRSAGLSSSAGSGSSGKAYHPLQSRTASSSLTSRSSSRHRSPAARASLAVNRPCSSAMICHPSTRPASVPSPGTSRFGSVAVDDGICLGDPVDGAGWTVHPPEPGPKPGCPGACEHSRPTARSRHRARTAPHPRCAWPVSGCPHPS